MDAEGPCWEWIGCIGKTGGYGKYTIPFRDGTGRSKYVYAHRYAWETLVGPVPDGLDLDHLCRNRKCVNPDHLEPVTRRENLMRGAGFVRKNADKTHCKNGHEYTAENTRVTSNGRACLACCRAWDRARWVPGVGRIRKGVMSG